MMSKHSNPLSFCSEFLKNKAYFGGYPSESEFHTLLDHGVTVFVDLITEKERNQMSFCYYREGSDRLSQKERHHHHHRENPKIQYLSFPIQDNSVPSQVPAFLDFLKRIQELLLCDSNKIYVHCRGGHGRSGIVVASLLSLIYDMSPEFALSMTTKFHKQRANLKTKWKFISCPQTFGQKRFVLRLFSERIGKVTNEFQKDTRISVLN